MRLAAHQPQFMPWLGYFDKMRSCDLFVMLDDVATDRERQYEWRCHPAEKILSRYISSRRY